CATVQIIPPDSLFGNGDFFTFDGADGVDCAAYGDFMAPTLNDKAWEVGATMSAEFVVTSCSGVWGGPTGVRPNITACGTFASNATAQLYQPEVGEVLEELVNFITGGTCPANLEGYTISAQIGGIAPSGALGGAEPSCVVGQTSQACNPRPPGPSPSPTPSPPLVKTHICVQSTNNIPFTISDIIETDTVDQLGFPAKQFCVKASAATCKQGTFCCGMDFAKMELPIATACKPELRRIVINNEFSIAYSWGFYDSFTTLKFPSLTKSLPSGPNNATLCWVVRPGPCADPATFCLNGRCQVNIFSSDNKCCPATIVN
ncbi:hypothetical protein HYH02_008399, partial [Chlamydomonas schloesseri]